MIDGLKCPFGFLRNRAANSGTDYRAWSSQYGVSRLSPAVLYSIQALQLSASLVDDCLLVGLQARSADKLHDLRNRPARPTPAHCRAHAFEVVAKPYRFEMSPTVCCNDLAYSATSMLMRATPDSIAAVATAGATYRSTRGSKGLGMM